MGGREGEGKGEGGGSGGNHRRHDQQPSPHRVITITSSISSDLKLHLFSQEIQEIPRKPAATDLFPRRLKSKLVRPKPNLWETTKEETKNLKNTLLKEKSESPKPVTRRNKMSKK